MTRNIGKIESTTTVIRTSIPWDVRLSWLEKAYSWPLFVRGQLSPRFCCAMRVHQ